jgi:hypothetical protein
VQRCKKNAWKKKHHPDKAIPRDIYLLGEGTMDNLFEKFKEKYTEYTETKSEFKNYLRELKQQGILVETE